MNLWFDSVGMYFKWSFCVQKQSTFENQLMEANSGRGRNPYCVLPTGASEWKLEGFLGWPCKTFPIRYNSCQLFLGTMTTITKPVGQFHLFPSMTVFQCKMGNFSKRIPFFMVLTTADSIRPKIFSCEMMKQLLLGRLGAPEPLCFVHINHSRVWSQVGIQNSKSLRCVEAGSSGPLLFGVGPCSTLVACFFLLKSAPCWHPNIYLLLETHLAHWPRQATAAFAWPSATRECGMPCQDLVAICLPVLLGLVDQVAPGQERHFSCQEM